LLRGCENRGRADTGNPAAAAIYRWLRRDEITAFRSCEHISCGNFRASARDNCDRIRGVVVPFDIGGGQRDRTARGWTLFRRAMGRATHCSSRAGAGTSRIHLPPVEIADPGRRAAVRRK
jgi:hypothetical protein